MSTAAAYPSPCTAYPDGAALLAYVQGTGIVKDPPAGSSALIQYATKMLTVADDLEQGTGYFPFLSDGTVTTVTRNTWDFMNRRLELGTGIISLSSLTINGVVLVEGQDYILGPTDAPQRKRPYTYIDLIGFQYYPQLYPGYGANGVVMVGVFGFCLNLSATAWENMLQWGLYLCYPELALKISGGRAGLKAGSVALQFNHSTGGSQASGGPLSGEKDHCQKNWQRFVRRHRR